MILGWIAWIAGFAYVIQTTIYRWGLGRLRDTVGSFSPFVSVVVAARDEEENIAACLDSILRQSYDREKFEVIVMNDDSADRTGAICREYASRCRSIRAYDVEPSDTVRGKTNALAQGIDRARGEVILITDADCVVPETWVEKTAARYGPGVGLVGGVTVQSGTSAFQRMQSLDWAYILGVAASGAAMGVPLGSIGNNLSFRRSAYDEVGGYRGLPFSVTEDYTLVQAIARSGRWQYLYPVDDEVLVVSKPCNDWKSVLSQKQRWGRGGLNMRPAGFVIMALTFAVDCFLLQFLTTTNFVSFALLFFLKSISDWMFLRAVLSKIHRMGKLRSFFAFECYFIVYTLILPFLVLAGRRIRWKGRTF